MSVGRTIEASKHTHTCTCTEVHILCSLIQIHFTLARDRRRIAPSFLVCTYLIAQTELGLCTCMYKNVHICKHERRRETKQTLKVEGHKKSGKNYDHVSLTQGHENICCRSWTKNRTRKFVFCRIRNKISNCSNVF